MSDYGGINQCKFIVQGIFGKTEVHHSAGSKHPLSLEPPTPQKQTKGHNTPAQTSAINSASDCSNTDIDIDDEEANAVKTKQD